MGWLLSAYVIMSTKGLTKEKIIAEAIAYIEESGQSKISLHELARRLGIKTPSLYNHIKNTVTVKPATVLPHQALSCNNRSKTKVYDCSPLYSIGFDRT